MLPAGLYDRVLERRHADGSNAAPLIIFDAPVGTLQINTANGFSLIDLDGASNAGVVNVNRNQTLDVNGVLADAFGGTMTLFQESTLDMSNSWSMNAGTLTVNNGFVAGGSAFPTPAGTSFIKGAMTQTGGAINVADTDNAANRRPVHHERRLLH